MALQMSTTNTVFLADHLDLVGKPTDYIAFGEHTTNDDELTVTTAATMDISASTQGDDGLSNADLARALQAALVAKRIQKQAPRAYGHEWFVQDRLDTLKHNVQTLASNASEDLEELQEGSSAVGVIQKRMNVFSRNMQTLSLMVRRGQQ